MGQELTQVLCPECGTFGESDPELSRWQCAKCGGGYFLRRCRACARVSYVDGLQGFRLPWPCTWCGQFNRGFSQNHDPAAASAAELAAEVTRYGQPGGAAGPGTGGQANLAPAADLGPSPEARDPGGGLTRAAGVGRPGTVPPPGLAAPPLPGRRRVGGTGLPMAMAVACAAVAIVLLAAGGPLAAGGLKAVGMAAGPGSTTRAVQVTASRVSTIELHGVPGQLTIVGAGSGQVVLTGQLHGTGGAPTIETRLERAAGVLVVSIRCATAGPCTENLRLVVPGTTGAAVWQPGGRVLVTGLAGPLRIAASSADISASGLRSTVLAAVITSGHLSAAFTAPPRQVSITLVSAQATLRLSGSVAYRVTQQVTSGYIRVGIPQADSATRTVTARIDSGELELLPS
jgi:ribosomal protein S27AE